MMKYKKNLNTSERLNDMQKYSESLIDECKQKNIPMNQDSNQLKHCITKDLRDDIPPQLYFVVSGLIDIIQRVEGVDKYENK